MLIRAIIFQKVQLERIQTNKRMFPVLRNAASEQLSPQMFCGRR